MKLPESLKKPKKPRFLLRRVRGQSMLPTLNSGQFVLAVRRQPKIGEVVIATSLGREVIKRVKSITSGSIYLVGDNPSASTDSRDYGLVKQEDILAVVVWPRNHH